MYALLSDASIPERCLLYVWIFYIMGYSVCNQSTSLLYKISLPLNLLIRYEHFTSHKSLHSILSDMYCPLEGRRARDYYIGFWELLGTFGNNIYYLTYKAEAAVS
jgi:hypothetical protein